MSPYDRILPIPIRADLSVHIANIPLDLTQAEARKIASVVMALATPISPNQERKDD